MAQSIADQLESFPMSPHLGQSLGRAREFALGQSHRALLLEHVLLALTEDPDASVVLQTCNVDLVHLGTDVSGYLARLPEDMRGAPGTEPRPDPELLRVLEAARQAAQQSRRRVIDGAIVLAAVVGDAKSPAAGLLKSHGMTFDEAIRALQKASAQARSKQFAGAPAQAPTEQPAAAATEKPVAAPAAAERVGSKAAAETPATGQSVDEILAAARARIQQRAAGVPNKPDAKPPAGPAPKAEPEPLPLMSLSSFKVVPAPPLPDLPPRLDGAHEQPADETAPAAPKSTAAPPSLAQRLSQPPLEKQVPPPRPQSSDGPPRPPQPQRAGGAAGPPLPGLPRHRGQPGPAGLPPAPRPKAPNGAMPGSHRPAAEMARSAARPGSPPRPGQRAAAGPLVETIPRRMRVGAAAPAQVRISRDKIDGLMQLLMGGRAQHRPDAVVARALSVRLRAPEGGFWIESASPETQWIELAAGAQQDEHISWRWSVTPQRPGRRRLQLLVTARMVGHDGIAAETAPPDRVIEVAVRGNRLRGVMRWIALLAVLGLGAALGRFGQDLWDAGPALLRSLGFLAG